MIEPERIQKLNDHLPVTDGQYVLYWMQQSQRASHNPALEYAIREANRLNKAVIVLFVLMEQYPEANERHFTFMLQGLREVAISLSKRGVPFVLRRGIALDVVPEVARNASVLVCDRGYLRHQREWRARIARELECPVIQIEGDVVVPVDLVSDRAEFAARTIRPKILRLRDDLFRPLPRARLRKRLDTTSIAADLNPLDTEGTLATLDIDRSVREVGRFKGGTTEARKHLRRFLNKGLVEYSTARNDPADPRCSTLSPYLHFGQISPVEASMKIHDTQNCSLADREAFLEQLVVRRELSINFVLHQRRYDQFSAVPEWARRSLRDHEKDSRPYTYSPATLEAAETHDPYWNAAMLEMLKTGFMHNYMRMYWGKKIIEWSRSPQRAYRMILRLNNKYFIDGRDPNSYASVAWLFGLHDQPWTERKVFGKVRYMNAAGLERKFDIKRYVHWVQSL
jgi:deoxyribodipyrimidine photo-lyase